MTDFRTLGFSEGLENIVRKSENLTTIRKFRPEAHSFKKGETFIGQFDEEDVKVLFTATEDTVTKTFESLSPAEIEKEGYKNSDEAFDKMKEYYNDLQPGDTMAIITYEVYKVEGVPVVQTIGG